MKILRFNERVKTLTTKIWNELLKLPPTQFQYTIGNFFASFAYPPTQGSIFKDDCAKKVHVNPFLRHQDFFRHYFTPDNPTKGMLVWHSVGIGKTCLAIADVSYAFEPKGWKVLWITRETLKTAPIENMFKGKCHKKIRDEYRKKRTDKEKETFLNSMNNSEERDSNYDKYVAQGWSGGGKGKNKGDRLLTYRVFSNICGHTQFLSQTKKLGMPVKWTDDRLYKTVIVFDEAHNLYNKTDLPETDQPNTHFIEQAI